MLQKILANYQVILGSKSPRRNELLKTIIPEFKVETNDIDESYPDNLTGKEIALYLSELKSKSFTTPSNELVITSDTIVILKNSVLGKPTSKEDAFQTLRLLSGNTHEVITGVTIKTQNKSISFADTTKVTFYPLSDEEINYYITEYKPYDKAGSYGIQEWIGHIGIKEMSGSFYNVMGLPTHLIYRKLLSF